MVSKIGKAHKIHLKFPWNAYGKPFLCNDLVMEPDGKYAKTFNRPRDISSKSGNSETRLYWSQLKKGSSKFNKDNRCWLSAGKKEPSWSTPAQTQGPSTVILAFPWPSNYKEWTDEFIFSGQSVWQGNLLLTKYSQRTLTPASQ
jgi:hypothetical protein